MEKSVLDEFVRGWLVGDFAPSIFRTSHLEVGVKRYRKGDRESWHVHKIAAEATVIVSGKVLMNSQEFHDGDIVVIPPGEGTDFECLTDVLTVVIKMPSVAGDKYTKDGIQC